MLCVCCIFILLNSLLLSEYEKNVKKNSCKWIVNVGGNTYSSWGKLDRKKISEKVLETECNLRKKLRNKRFCSETKQTFQCKNNRSNVSFKLNTIDEATRDSENYVLDVVAVDINSNFINVFLVNETTEQSVVTNHSLPMKNVGHYSVLGFDNFNDTDDDVFLDLNFSVRFNWTIQSAMASTAFRTFLNQNEAKIFAVKSASLKCVFINTDEGSYSDSGCRSTFTPDFRHISCECDHATIFTIILSVSVITVPFTVEV